MKSSAFPFYLIPAVIICILSANTSADTMAIWAFGIDTATYTESVTTENIPLVPTLLAQGGEKDENGKDGIEYTDASGIYHPAGRALAWDNVNTDTEMIITLETTGWENIFIRWDYFSENTVGDLGPESFDLDYRIGGSGDWINIINNGILTRDDAWHTISVDLSAVEYVSNWWMIEFRINDLDRGEESGGQFRIDNLEIHGTPNYSFTVLGPNGTEQLISRNNYELTWQSTGSVDSVLLGYSVDNGLSYEEIAVADNSGSYNWFLPDANSNQCLFRVRSADFDGVSDVSNSIFSIRPCSVSYDLNGDCYIDIADFALLASEWLSCGNPYNPGCI